MIQITVIFMGSLAEVTNNGKLQITLDDNYDTVHLQENLFKRYHTLKDKTYSIAVNESIQNQTCTLNNGDEVVLLPPFSGG